MMWTETVTTWSRTGSSASLFLDMKEVVTVALELF